MYYPKLEDIESYRSTGNLVPVYRTINADLETPVSAYLKVAEGEYSFLLESVSGGEQLSRYSFIGTAPYKVIKTGKDQPQGTIDPLTLIQEELNKFQEVSVDGLPAFNGGGLDIYPMTISITLNHEFQCLKKMTLICLTP